MRPRIILKRLLEGNLNPLPAELPLEALSVIMFQVEVGDVHAFFRSNSKKIQNIIFKTIFVIKNKTYSVINLIVNIYSLLLTYNLQL